MKALREMAAAEGCVDAALLQEVEQLDELSQKLRRDLVDVLVSDSEKFKKLKTKVEKITTAEC
jgi:hypothetical protein